jgi:hypothetical protein
MNDKPKQPSDGDVAGEEGSARPSSSSALIEKIKSTLANTAPERWEQGGEPLDTNRRFQRAQTTWEEIFSTDTKTGVLVFRRSTPLISNFFGGGYNFTAAAASRHVIELRGRGWSPKTLLDPSFRGSGGAERSCQILAEGEIALKLFEEVEQIVGTYRDSLRRDFSDSVARLAANLKEQVEGTAAADWSPVEGDIGYKGYRTEINGLTITVGCVSNDLSSAYSLSLSRLGLVWHCRYQFLMQQIYTIVHESVKTASLEQLGKVLEDML